VVTGFLGEIAMDEQKKRELKAVGKIAIGGAQMVGGVATGLGYGVGSFITGKHHMTALGGRMGLKSFESGKKTLEDGWRELKELRE
jgi:hypothetical protein